MSLAVKNQTYVHMNDLGYKFLKLRYFYVTHAARYLDLHSQGFCLLRCMKEMVFQQKIKTQSALLCHILDTATFRKDNCNELT